MPEFRRVFYALKQRADKRQLSGGLSAADGNSFDKRGDFAYLLDNLLDAHQLRHGRSLLRA